MIERVLAQIAALNGGAPPGRGGAPLIVAAHPDDETIGAGGILGHLPAAVVLHVTSGVPRDRRFFPEGYLDTPAQYAADRRDELVSALSLAGVGLHRLLTLAGVDQEVAFQIAPLARELAGLLDMIAPSLIVTHPYEGGHPDHDATALIVHAAIELVRRRRGAAPSIVEMSSYHAGPDGLVSGDFLPADGAPITTIALSDIDRARKQAMIARFHTQRRTLAAFATDVERFRPAPRYDFGAPPHAGPLFYEQMGWPLSGERFRALARQALAELGLEGRACR